MRRSLGRSGLCGGSDDTGETNLAGQSRKTLEILLRVADIPLAYHAVHTR